MKRIFIGVIALVTFGTATAQVQTPTEVPADPAHRVQPAPTQPVRPVPKRKTPRAGVVAAVAAGVVGVAVLASGGSDSDDRPSSP